MTTAKKQLTEKERIDKIIEELRIAGVLQRLSGQCIAAADILQNMMDDYGIPARMVECKLAIFSKDPDGAERISFVGYDGASDSTADVVDTHVVVVTNSEKPILVDLSIGDLLPSGVGYVAEYLDSVDPEVIAKIRYGDVFLTYRPKLRTRYPQLHQKTLLERLRGEASLKQTLSLMKWLIVAGFALGAVNLFLNLFNISMKVF